MFVALHVLKTVNKLTLDCIFFYYFIEKSVFFFFILLFLRIGDKFIKASTDLSSIKRRLGESPIDVIQLLARGIAKRDKSENV